MLPLTGKKIHLIEVLMKLLHVQTTSSYRKHLSVKFPDDLPITLPNLVRFLLRHVGDVPRRGGWSGSDRSSLLEVELRRLREEVEALRRAREQLSQQLSQLWQEKRRLALHAQGLESRNAELCERGRHLEELYREKNRQLLDAAGKLQALADASQNLITENALLKVLMASMREEVALQPRVDDGAPKRAKHDLSTQGDS